MHMNRTTIYLALGAAFALSGCVMHETRPLPQIKAEQASAEIPEAQLLDVGVRLFEENVPKDEKQLERKHIFPEVRKAEARFLPMQIRNTLEGTGHWGQVRVMPEQTEALDVYISGVILESSGQHLNVDVTVTDATGRTWFRKTYEQAADTRAYKNTNGAPRDPFQNFYSNLANDMLAHRAKLTGADLENVRRVAKLKFASELAPFAFANYLQQDKKKGVYQVTRLPAEDDPLVVRMDRIRERDYALLDTINEHYSLFAENMAEPYTNWRRYSYDELEAKDEAARSALTRKLLGAAAIVGGLMMGNETGSYAGRAAATGAVFGGAYAIKSGFDKGAEVKMHSDSLKQLGESFQAEVEPMVVEVEGRTLQLQGTAEEQFIEWRQLLKDLYENETGLAVQTPAPAASSTESAPAEPASGG
jgi:hypothetical protein